MARGLESFGGWSRRIRSLLPLAESCGGLGLFLLALVAMWRLDPSRTGLLWDAQVYYFISERVASGIPPHVSEFDPKNALSMLLSGMAIRMGRVFGADDLLVARLLSIVGTAAVFPLLGAVVRRLGGTRGMARCAALLPLVFPEFLFLAVVGANPKIFLMFFETLWMLAATFEAPLALGILSAACFLTWQPALLLLAAAALPLLFREGGRLRALARLAAGFVVPVVAYEAYFLWHGALGDQVYQAFVFPAEFGRHPRPLLDSAIALLQLKPPRGMNSLLLCTFAALLTGWWAACLAAPRRMWPWFRARPARGAVLLGASGTFAFGFHDFQGYADRLFFFPFLAVAVGAAAGFGIDRISAIFSAALPSNTASDRSTSRTGTVLFAAAGIALLLVFVPDRGLKRNTLGFQRLAAREVAVFARRGRTVYAMGPLHLLAMNRMDNFNRFGFFPVRVSAYLDGRLSTEKDLLPLRDGKLPDVLLQTRNPAPGSARWIQRYYRRSHSPGLDRERVRLWLLRDDGRPPADASPM